MSFCSLVPPLLMELGRETNSQFWAAMSTYAQRRPTSMSKGKLRMVAR